MVYVTVDAGDGETAAVKLQDHAWELNLHASLADLRKLKDIQGRELG